MGGLKDFQGAREYGPLKEFVEKTFKKPCDWKTGKGCAANEKEFIEKWKDKSAAEVKEEMDKRNADLKQVRKDKSAAEADLKAKIKEFTKKEKNMQKSLNLPRIWRRRRRRPSFKPRMSQFFRETFSFRETQLSAAFQS